MLNTLLLAGWIGCQALDAGTTYVALHRPGFREVNPIPHVFMLKFTANIGGIALQKGVIERRHPREKKRFILPLVYAAVGCLAGGLNLRTLASRR